MSDKLQAVAGYVLAWIQSIPADQWYVVGSVLGSALTTIGVVGWIKRRHLKKHAEKLANHFVTLNLVFWSTIMTVASFVVTYGTQFGAFLPFLSSHMPQIMVVATTLYTVSKGFKRWYQDRKDNKPLVDTISPKTTEAIQSAAEQLPTPTPETVSTTHNRPEPTLLQL